MKSLYMCLNVLFERMIGVLSDTLLALMRNPETPDGIIQDAIRDERGENVAKVYIVFGSKGEYSDYREWGVAAFLVEDHAMQFVVKINQWKKENPEAERCPFDSQYQKNSKWDESHDYRYYPLELKIEE